MPSAPGSQKELLGPLWKITALILLEVSKYSALVFQLGPKPPLFSLESRQRSASERLAGGLEEGSLLITKLEKRRRSCLFPSHRGAGRAAAKLQLLPSLPCLFPLQGGTEHPKRALGVRGFGRRTGGVSCSPQSSRSLQIRGEKAAWQPVFGRGASSLPHLHCQLRCVETFSALDLAWGTHGEGNVGGGGLAISTRAFWETPTRPSSC